MGAGVTGTTATRSRIDPRIAQRRRSVALERTQHRRRIVAGVLVAAVVVAALVALTRSPVLDVDVIAVQGPAGSAERDAVAAAASVALGDPMVDLDTDAVGRGVEQIAWVRSAEVSRRWPGTVVVEVESRVAVAAVNRQPRGSDPASVASWSLVDGDGVIIDVVDGVPVDLPRLVGGTADGSLGSRVGPSFGPGLAAAGAFPDSMAPALDHLAVTDRGVDVVMGPRGSLTVNVGTGTDIDAAYRSLAALIEADHLGCATAVDLEVPDRPLLTRDPDCP